MDEVYDFLKKAGNYYLATMDGDQPRVRPLGSIDRHDGKLYIQTGKIKEVAKQIEKNPRVEICALADGAWVRIDATLVEDTSVATQEHMLEAVPVLKKNYKVNDGNNEVLCMSDASATFFSFADPTPRTIKF